MPSPGVPSEAAIREWCLDFIARTLEIPVDAATTPEMKFSRIGLDSASGLHLVVELEEWLGIELEPELLGDYPTIAALSRHLAGRLSAGGG